MFSLPKRKSEPVVDSQPPWRPDFRNAERLPDTKVIRTAFFINGIPLVIAVAATLWFLSSEYRLRDLHRQIDETQTEIDRNRRASTQAIGLYKNFQAQSARITEVDAFLKSKPLVADILLRLAETLPANVAIDGFDYHDLVVVLRGTVRGSPDQASGYASSYVLSLKADQSLGAKFDEITLVSLARNPQTGRLSMEISMHLKATATEAKKS
jgi:hypothetical protein